MADQKQIRVGVDNSAFEQYQSQMRQSADSLMRDMIRSARGYTTSSKEVLSTIEEQIRAIEKRNRLDEEFRKQRLQRGVEEGAITQEQYKQRLGEVTGEGREDRLQTQLLRDILESLKSTSKEEIREDRLNVERRLQASKTVSQLKPEGDEYANLKETLQQAEISRLRGDEFEQATGGRLQRYGMIPADFISARSATDVMQQGTQAGGNILMGMGKGGMIGAIVAMTLGKLIGEAGTVTSVAEQNLQEYSILRRRAVRGMGGEVSGLADLARYGLTPTTYLQNVANLEANARTRNLGESALNLMNLERGTMLGQGDVAGMAGLRRFGGGGVSATAMFFDRYLREVGESVAVLPEIIQTFTAEARNIIAQTGRVDTERLATFITQVGEQTGLRGELLTGAVQSFRQGMAPSQNPVIRMMQMRAARQVAGAGASLWDVEKVMADPSRFDYLQVMLQNLQGVTGGGQAYERAISNVFGFNPNLTQQVSKLDLGKDIDQDMKKLLGQQSVSQEANAVRTVGAQEQSRMGFTETKERKMFDQTERTLDAASDVMEGLKSMTKDINMWMDRIGEKGGEWGNKAGEGIANAIVRGLSKLGL